MLVVFPRAHYRDIYTVPVALARHLFGVVQILAIGTKQALSADGITLLQNNDSAGGQDVWHVHLHVIPRFSNDRFHSCLANIMPLAARSLLARRLRATLREIRGHRTTQVPSQ